MYNDIEKFINDMEHRGMAENTTETYEIHLRHFYSYCKQKNLNYQHLRPKDLNNYTKAAVQTGDTNATVNVRLSAIKSFYDYLIDEEKTIYNPVTKRTFLKNKGTVTEPLTDDEVNMILNYMKGKPDHIRLGFEVLFSTGLRVSELADLKKEDIRIIKNRVILNIRHGKRGQRIVPIFNEEVAIKVLKYIENTNYDPIFKVKKRTFQYHAKKCGENLGIYFTIHQTRHTFATNMLREGMRLDILQKVLGHKDISTTMLYAKTLDLDVISSAQPIKSS